MELLKFGKANAKLAELQRATGLRIATFSLPAGRTCPGAVDCKAMVRVDANGRRVLIDGKDAIFRCFAASQEAQYTATFDQRVWNLAQLKAARSPQRIADLIVASIPKNVDAVRWHVSGDFYSKAYMRGMFRAFERMPEKRAYFYTKSIHHLVALASEKPKNVSVTGSIGGRYDRLIHEHGVRWVAVYGSATQAHVPIDHDDSHALEPNTGALGGEHFGLIVHGTQAPGSWGAKQLVQLRAKGINSGYSRGRKAS